MEQGLLGNGRTSRKNTNFAGQIGEPFLLYRKIFVYRTWKVLVLNSRIRFCMMIQIMVADYSHNERCIFSLNVLWSLTSIK